jgi:hypothetical protein
MTYRVSADLLEHMFPVDAGIDAKTLRRHQEIGCPFCDRGPDSQPGAVALGVIYQPRALADQTPVQRP